MSTASPPRTLTVALVGNPNTGKSTLFNALVGGKQRVGNYPGVTVERKTGRASWSGREFLFVDLPGTYSLAPRSPDEMVTVDVLLGRRDDTPPIDAVLCIVDASNLERNLYVVSQLLELGLPTVIALNMTDVAREKGVAIDIVRLRKQLPLAIVPVQANQRIGIDELRTAIAAAADAEPARLASPFPPAFQAEVAALEALAGESRPPRFLLERLLLDTSGYLAASNLPGLSAEVLGAVQPARERLAKSGAPVPAVEAMARYRWAAETLQGAVERKPTKTDSFSDRVDRVLTHWFTGTLAFVLVMFLVFQAVAWISGPSADATDALTGWAKDAVAAVTADGDLRSLLQVGVVDGVGGVIVFVPQIALLFLFIAVLEDCGYMARAAYLMDRVMSQAGLSGKSFIPLLSSFACAIPGIMAARVIENRRDRFVTMLIAPLMSCSARLPVYILMAFTFLPHTYLAGVISLPVLAIVGMYFLGIFVAMAVAWVLKKTFFRGATPPFVMELPTYKWPGVATVYHRVLEQVTAFVVRAGTLILAISIIVWALAYYPRSNDRLDPALVSKQAELAAQAEKMPQGDDVSAELKSERERMNGELTSVTNEIEATHLRYSYLGQMGRFIEPAVKPLGWDWRIGCAAIASFPAREVIVATLGIIYGLGGDVDEAEDSPLRTTLQNATWEGTERKVFNVPVALSVMVFFALCAQCSSTLAVMYKETGGWQWPLFTFVYMTTLAYIGAMLTYQLGMAAGWGG